VFQNVYSNVQITLQNEEFGEITSKELDIAKYLDLVGEVRTLQVDEDETQKHIYFLSKIRPFTTLKNFRNR